MPRLFKDTDKIMNWKSWKLGLFVAAITGIASAWVAGIVIPGITLKEFGILCGTYMFKDVILYLKQHPADTVTFDTTTITRQDSTGAKTTATHSTVTQPAGDPPK